MWPLDDDSKEWEELGKNGAVSFGRPLGHRTFYGVWAVTDDDGVPSESGVVTCSGKLVWRFFSPPGHRTRKIHLDVSSAAGLTTIPTKPHSIRRKVELGPDRGLADAPPYVPHEVPFKAVAGAGAETFYCQTPRAKERTASVEINPCTNPHETLAKFRRAVDAVKGELISTDLPPWTLNPEGLIAGAANITIDDQPGEAEFECHVSSGKMSVGVGVLNSIEVLQDEEIARVSKMLFVHEVYHDFQGIQTTTYAGVGRAGNVLEHIDYWADAVAIAALAHCEIRRGGEAAAETYPALVELWISSLIRGIMAFDRHVQPRELAVLYERRLRRYLLWLLQLVRSQTLVHFGSQWEEAIWSLLGERPVVELAPLPGKLDERGDKIVGEPTDDTELFVALRVRLLRLARQRSSFEPTELLEAIRAYDVEAAMQVMQYVRDSEKDDLSPWVPSSRSRS